MFLSRFVKGYYFPMEGIRKGYHLSIEGIRKGYLFCQRTPFKPFFREVNTNKYIINTALTYSYTLCRKILE